MITDIHKQHPRLLLCAISRRSHVKARTRFLKSVISAAKSDSTELPWTRGAIRQARIATRRLEDRHPEPRLRLKSA